MMPVTHYQHSGKVPLGGLLLTLLVAMPLCAALGALYGFLVFWSPFVYINAIMTFGLGFLLAVVVGGFAKVGRIRNNGAVTVLALLGAGIAFVVHWGMWVSLIVDERVMQPQQIWALAASINALGPWSIFGWTPSGFSLWAIWGLEAAMIFGISAITALGMIDVPFCEATGQWMEDKPLSARFRAVDGSVSLESPSALLGALVPDADGGPEYAEVSVAAVDGSELRCVSLHNVTVETDKDGKEETEKTTLIKYMLFDRVSFDRLLQMGSPAVA